MVRNLKFETQTVLKILTTDQTELDSRSDDVSRTWPGSYPDRNSDL